MKHYRATPVRGTPGEPIVARGLRALYDAANTAWDLTATYPSVRNNMLPEGRVYKTRDGWVQIAGAPDADAEYDAEQLRGDDRTADYMADVYITALDGGKDYIEKKFDRVRAKGLLSLIGEAVALISAEIGVVPPCLAEDEVRKRLPNMRAQMSKSRAAHKEVYSIAFPTIQEGHWTGPFPHNHDYRFYINVAKDYEAPVEHRGFTRR